MTKQSIILYLYLVSLSKLMLFGIESEASAFYVPFFLLSSSLFYWATSELKSWLLALKNNPNDVNAFGRNFYKKELTEVTVHGQQTALADSNKAKLRKMARTKDFMLFSERKPLNWRNEEKMLRGSHRTCFLFSILNNDDHVIKTVCLHVWLMAFVRMKFFWDLLIQFSKSTIYVWYWVI